MCEELQAMSQKPSVILWTAGGTSEEEGSDVSLVLSGDHCGAPMAGHGSEAITLVRVKLEMWAQWAMLGRNWSDCLASVERRLGELLSPTGLTWLQVPGVIQWRHRKALGKL